MKTLFLKCVLGSALSLALGSAAYSKLNPAADVDGNGVISAEEFILFNGEKDQRQRDANKDGVLSAEEWKGKSTAGFRHITWDRFNTDGDNTLSASEIVEVYLWTFTQRDKNKDGKLTGGEIPKSFKT